MCLAWNVRVGSAPDEGPLDWSVTTPRASYYPGEPVRLDFTMTNTGTETVEVCFGSNGEEAFSFRLTDSAGVVIAIGSNQFGWLPPNFATGNAVRFWEDPIQNLETFFFPSLVLSLGIAAVIMRLTRSSMLEVMRNDYVRTAWSKGLKERTVVWRHALKNAMIPVLTIIGLQVGALIGGAVLIESVFALNGIGRYLLVSVIGRDLLVVQSLVLIFAFVFVVINLIVDVLYAWLDPRIRYG